MEVFEKVVKGSIDPNTHGELKLPAYAEMSIQKVARLTDKANRKSITYHSFSIPLMM